MKKMWSFHWVTIGVNILLVVLAFFDIGISIVSIFILPIYVIIVHLAINYKCVKQCLYQFFVNTVNLFLCWGFAALQWQLVSWPIPNNYEEAIVLYYLLVFNAVLFAIMFLYTSIKIVLLSVMRKRRALSSDKRAPW